jgi:hypothetical protein
MLAMLRARVWWEYVESNGNWSDSTSREGLSAQWAADQQFQVQQCLLQVWAWDRPITQLVPTTRDFLQM